MKILLLLFTLALFCFTYAQNKYSLTDITQDGDLIIIPEQKFSEFIQNYKPEKKHNLQKITLSEGLEGTVTDALTTQPLANKKITLNLYDPNNGTFLGTGGPVWTDITGHYIFNNITDVDDEQQTENQGTIKYEPNKPNIQLNLKKYSKLEVYISDGLGQNTKIEEQEIVPGTHEININKIRNYANGIYFIATIIDGQMLANKIAKVDNNYKWGTTKNKTNQLEKQINKTLEKITEIGATITILDSTNQYHEYINGPMGNWTGQRSANFTLIPKINLEEQIVDPEYNIIPIIRTQRDLIWYTARIQGEWDNQEHVNRQFPIQLFIDENNAPTGGAIDARSVIQYFQDSLDIHPDSLIKESPTDIPPDFHNGISAIKIIWTDSIGTEGFNMTQGFTFSSSHNTFIGGELSIDTNKVVGEDIGKYVALGLQRYITGGINPINNQKYLGYTTANRIGPTKRPNNDEKKFIKIGRNSKPYYINRVYP